MSKERMKYVLLNYAKDQLKDVTCPFNEEEFVTLLNCYVQRKSSSTCQERLQREDVNVNVWYTRLSMALAMDALVYES